MDACNIIAEGGGIVKNKDDKYSVYTQKGAFARLSAPQLEDEGGQEQSARQDGPGGLGAEAGSAEPDDSGFASL